MPTNRLQYTIRGLTAETDRKLKSLARKEGLSLNALCLKILNSAFGHPTSPENIDPLKFMYGSWIEDPEMDQALRQQREIEEDLWR